MGSLTIGKLASSAGVGVETVRFYQRKGLLSVPARAGGVREYGAEDVRRLRFIRKAQTAGFTLEEIKELIRLDATNDRPRARELASERLKALDERIGDLKRAQASLKRLVGDCASGKEGPCPILEAFEV